MVDNNQQRLYWEEEHGHREYDHPVVSYFAQQRIRYILSWLDISQINTALDVGCGNGFSTFYMNQHISDVFGIDVSRYMLSRHPFRDTKRVMVADGNHLSFADNSFDLVFAWEALHHIADPSIVVKEMARVSKNLVLVAEPNRNHPAQFLFALLDPAHFWVLRYTKKYMIDLFESAKLSILYKGAGGWLFPNVTPEWLLPVIKVLPYSFPLGISNWLLGQKSGGQ